MWQQCHQFEKPDYFGSSKAEEGSLNDEISFQMRKRKALPAQAEACTPHKKSMRSMSPATESLQYQDVKTTWLNLENSTTSKSGVPLARRNLNEGITVSRDKLKVFAAENLSGQEKSMVRNEPLPPSNRRKSPSTSVLHVCNESSTRQDGHWNKGGSSELQDKDDMFLPSKDDLCANSSRSEAALSVNTTHQDISCVDDGSTLDKASSPSYAPTPSIPVMPRQTAHKLKRKALSDMAGQKQHFQMTLPSSSSIEEIAEISSYDSLCCILTNRGNQLTFFSFRFSDSSGSETRALLRRTPVKGKTALLGKIPPLDLRTIAPPGPGCHEPNPPTSPLEEISMIDSSNSLEAAPSLYLEVKQRIAAHVSTRRRDKHIKVSSKSAATASGNATDDDDESVVDLSSASSSPRSSSPPKVVASTKRRNGKDMGIAKGKSKEVAEKPKAKGTKGKKEKPAPVTPEEYAQKLAEKVQAKMGATTTDVPIPNHRFLHGMNVFYTGGDMTYASERTRGRMDLIVRHGGTLLPRYDPSITTHIVTDAKVPATLRALGLNDLSEIPDHIPTVTWDWVLKGFSRPSNMKKDIKMHMDDSVFWHAAFVQRIDAGMKVHPRANDKGKAKVEPKTPDAVEQFTQDKPRRPSISSSRSIRDVNESDDEEQDAGRAQGALLSPPTSPDQTGREKRSSAAASSLSILQAAGPSKASDNGDPLAEFYAKARAEAETKVSRGLWARRGEVTESEGPPSESDVEESAVARGPSTKRGWTCDTKEAQRNTCINQDIIDKVGSMICIRALRNYPKRIASFAEARAIRGIGEKTAAK
ncbi:hypothetical protein C0993_011047, partial [Termitomyces sp. T159_Od127]